MSASEEHPITCPSCSAASGVRVHRTVNVTAEPERKSELLTGQLFLLTCRACGTSSRVVHPELVYQDAAKGILLQMDALGTFDRASLHHLEEALPKTTRVVRDSNALIEKVKIFDAGLDDRIVEALKLVLASQGGGGEASRFLFEGTGTRANPGGSELRFTVLTASGISGVALPRTAYDDLRDRLGSAGRLETPGAWAVVDADYAHILLTT